MAILPQRPAPAPTPYQSPQYGGNPYVTKGTVGMSIPRNATPNLNYTPANQSTPVSWSSGAVTPASSVNMRGGQILGQNTIQQEPGPGGAFPIAQGPNPNPTGGAGGAGGSGGMQQSIPQGGGGGGEGGLAPAGSGGPSQMDLINQEFNNFQSFLGEQEGLARGRFADTEGMIGRDKGTALENISGQRDIRQQELEGTAQSGRDTERLNLSKVRQMLQELEQRDAARIALTGGGSMADATADRFGRTAQESSGQVMQEGQRFQNQVAMEQTKANQFYDQKVAEVENQSANAINQARQMLDQNLSSIEGERRSSAAAKQQARYSAWQDYHQSVNQARLQAANFQAQYDMWKRQLDAQLAASQGYQAGDVAGQDFSGALNNIYQAQGLGNTGAQSGMMEDPQTAATYFRPGTRPDEDENQAFAGLGIPR